MKKILISEAGGAPSINVVKSIRDINEDYHLIGISSDKYLLALADVDERFLVPSVNDPKFGSILLKIIEQTSPDVILSQNDAVLTYLSLHRDKISPKLFLPDHETMLTCHNKYLSYQKWEQAGLKLPKTILLRDKSDLKKAFKTLGEKIWIRATEGWSGKGALCTSDVKFAEAWINYYNGWGNFTAAEYLSPQSVTWMSIWRNGELIVGQGRKRIEWRFGHHSISGVTGQTGVAMTVSDPIVDETALKAILSVDPKPHGIYSVDMTYDSQGTPNPTEINIGRFFATSYFFTAAGLNMAKIVLDILFDEEVTPFKKPMNPLKEGLIWIRQIDSDPKLLTLEGITDLELNYKKI